MGAGVGVGAAIFLLFAAATAAAALTLVVASWLALLIVTGVLLGISVTLVLVALPRLKQGAPPVPEQAISEARLTMERLKANGRHR
jgi:hypothetical protein